MSGPGGECEAIDSKAANATTRPGRDEGNDVPALFVDIKVPVESFRFMYTAGDQFKNDAETGDLC